MNNNFIYKIPNTYFQLFFSDYLLYTNTVVLSIYTSNQFMLPDIRHFGFVEKASLVGGLVGGADCDDAERDFRLWDVRTFCTCIGKEAIFQYNNKKFAGKMAPSRRLEEKSQRIARISTDLFDNPIGCRTSLFFILSMISPVPEHKAYIFKWCLDFTVLSVPGARVWLLSYPPVIARVALKEKRSRLYVQYTHLSATYNACTAWIGGYDVNRDKILRPDLIADGHDVRVSHVARELDVPLCGEQRSAFAVYGNNVVFQHCRIKIVNNPSRYCCLVACRPVVDPHFRALWKHLQQLLRRFGNDFRVSRPSLRTCYSLHGSPCTNVKQRAAT